MVPVSPLLILMSKRLIFNNMLKNYFCSKGKRKQVPRFDILLVKMFTSCFSQAGGVLFYNRSDILHIPSDKGSFKVSLVPLFCSICQSNRIVFSLDKSSIKSTWLVLFQFDTCTITWLKVLLPFDLYFCGLSCEFAAWPVQTEGHSSYFNIFTLFR